MSTYTNPILNADWPDPDVTRFGDEFVLVASSFNRSPGLPVLCSDDLVHWRHAGNALPALEPADHFRLPRHGGGVWASAIREHEGRLVIVFPDPDHGIWTMWAERPEGPWTKPHLLIEGSGLIDPCPFWDADGSAYIVHGWAKSRAGIKNRLTLVPVDASLTRAIGPGQSIINGDELEGYGTLEGPKIYKRDDWYWIFAPAGGVATGWQSVFRSHSIRGPYEGRIVLSQGQTDVNGPHQGGWVTDVQGSDWFVHFQDRGPYGRVVHLQPMTWSHDGWPRMGTAGNDQCGEPVAGGRRPASRSASGPQVVVSPVSDRFDSADLLPQWHWSANPRHEWWRTGGGSLQLHHVPNDRGDLRQLPQVLSQLLPGSAITAAVTVTLGGAHPGARAGVVVLGREHSWVGLRRGEDATIQLVRGTGVEGGAESTEVIGVWDSPALQVRLTSAADERVTWAVRGEHDGEWEVVSVNDVRPGHWIGADIGLVAAAPEGLEDTGWSSFTNFTITHE